MATSADEAKDGKAFYGYLFSKAKPIPVPTPVLDALLRAIALHIANEIGDRTEQHLTPAKLAAFYKSAGHDFDSFFVEMPHAAISTVYQGLGCQHMLLPSGDDFAAPCIPALTVKGFVRWQAIQTLLGPQTQVPVLQFVVANWALKHPDTGTPLPVDLPSEAFPSETDPDTDRWHQECADRARSEATEAEPTKPPREEPKPEFTDRKVPYAHVRVSPTTPRDYFAARPVNVAYVHVSSPRPMSARRSPERERAREREHYVRRPASSSGEPAPRRRSFSDYPNSPHYPHSPHEARPVRVPHVVPERSPPPHRHSQPRHYSSASESDGVPISPRTTSRPKRSNEPPPISVRRVYTGSPEGTPRVVRTTMPPPPIPAPHLHSPRPHPATDSGSNTPRHDDSKRRSALFDLKEKLTSFINPGAISGSTSERPRSVSGSRGKRDGLGGSSRGSRDDVPPSSRLSRSWSEIDTEDSDSEDERRRRSRRPSHDSRERQKEREREREMESLRERDRERERTRDRDRVLRERELDRDRDRDGDRERGRDRPRERDRPHSDRDIDDRRRDRDRDRDRDRLGPIDRPAAAAAAASLHRGGRRGGSDDDISPRGWARGPYLATTHRRTNSHDGIDRATTRREWDLLDRERERERDFLRDRDRERNRDRERERFREEGDRWQRREERLSRDARGRERERERDRDRDRDRERMPSPAVSSVTGVGGRRYPDVSWARD
ncbi:hypothetical protein VTK56DRAFT_2495 [Thermocarpiscus australiensis]